jgi:hypothetical protein
MNEKAPPYASGASLGNLRRKTGHRSPKADGSAGKLTNRFDTKKPRTKRGQVDGYALLKHSAAGTLSMNRFESSTPLRWR